MKKILFWQLLFMSLCSLAFAQPPGGGQKGGRPGGRGGMPYDQRPAIGQLNGTIVDTTSGNPLGFAKLTLILSRRNAEDTVVSGGLSNEKGKFLIENIRPGRYKVRIEYMGFESKTIDRVMVSPRDPEVDMGKIYLRPGEFELEEVTITAEKEFMEIGIDRQIYNTDKLLTAQGGSANALLANIPSVEVDIDGNLSLRGSGNVTVLIDGKPSGLTGDDRAAILEQIPASSIDKIEVITNPSAKYDADGMTGIINIILKKNKWLGLNGSVTFSAGTGDKYNASANLNYRNKRFNVFANYSYRLDNRWGEGFSSRKNLMDSTFTVLDQESRGSRQRASHLLRTGGDIYLNKNNTLSVSALFSPREGKRNDKILYLTSDEWGKPIDFYQRLTDDNSDGFNTDYNLSYDKKFAKKGQELTASINYSRSGNEGLAQFEQQDLLPDMSPSPDSPELQNNLSVNRFTVTTLQFDYVHPIGEKHKLEAGYKSIFRFINNDFKSETFNYTEGDFVSDTALNNEFQYEEGVHAAYSTFSGQTKRWSYQLGLRVEQAITTSTLITSGESFENNYFNLFPSGFLTYQLAQSQEIQISYTRRINRPRTRQLNPFTNYTDPLNLRRGNPLLQPEYIDALELSYNKKWEKTTFLTSAYYRHVSNVIQRVRSVDSTGVATTTYDNLESADSYGLEVILSSRIFTWWSLNASGNFYYTLINGSNLASDLNNEGYGWSIRMNNQFKLPWGLEGQLTGRYRGPRPTSQGRIKGFYTTDIALKKSFLDKKASLSIRVSDIFNNRQFMIASSGENFEQESTRKRESRIAFLTFSYRFGKSNFKDRKRNRGRNGGSSDGGMDDMEMD